MAIGPPSDVSNVIPGAAFPGAAFRAIFEAIPSPCLVLETSPEFIIVGANAAYLKATMTRLGNIVGKPLFDVFPDNPDNPGANGVAVITESLNRVVASGEMDVLPVHRYDIRCPEHEGNGYVERYWSPKNIPVVDARGRVVYLLHMAEDVTDFVKLTSLLSDTGQEQEQFRKRIQALEAEMFQQAKERHETNLRLREANAALARLDETKAVFFTDVSHEFRTPLTLILGPLEDELAETEAPLPPKRRARLELAYRNCQRLLTLDNCLLDFARVVAGKAETAYEATDLATLTADVAANFRGLFEQAGLTLTVDCAPLAEPVYVDRGMWEKVVLNLISNAFKFTMVGGVTIRVSVDDGLARLEVRDTGIGIPANELPHIFERFHRVRGARGRTIAGSGIGLALTRELVGLHGGEIQVESPPGQGSVFTVRVPLGNAHLPAEAILDQAPLSAPVKEAQAFVAEASRWLPISSASQQDSIVTALPAKDGPRPRILVAEDNPDIRDYIERILHEHYEIEMVADGEQALARALQNPPDLVLSDSMMPSLDGLGLLRALRAAPKIQTVPFILLSARASEEDRLTGRLAGADDYLTKPFNSRELLAHIAANLELSRLRNGAAPGAPSAGNARILIVDDNPDSVGYLKALFEAQRYETLTATDGETALLQVRDGKPDLVITDLLMPKVDGFEFIRRLRNNPETAAIRVIVLTGTFRDRSAESLGEALGVARYLRKPISSQTLLSAVNEVLQLPAAMQRIPEALLDTLADTYRNLMSAAFFAKEADLVREIEARRLVERELRDREQQLLMALQIGRIGTIEVDLTTNRVRGSAELAALCGMPAVAFESDIETLIRDRVHPDDQATLYAQLEEARSTGHIELEWRTLWPDGTVRWLAGRAAASREANTPPQRLIGVDIDITERKEAETNIRRASQHDPLTGLPNRGLFHELAAYLLAGQQRAEQPAALLFIDLDRFKPINDIYGHAVGDAVLNAVSLRLTKCVRGEDVVGRLGGDEFVALLGHIHDEENAARVATHMLETLRQPYVVNGFELNVFPSIGISLFPRDGSDVNGLIQCADSAMYAAKQGGSNAYQFYRADLNRSSQELMCIEKRLSKALEFGEFELVWLPVIDLESGNAVGAEALLRWPGTGIPPERFLPMAETMGIMAPLCQWVLTEACRVRQAWRQHGLPDFPVSVNITSKEFRQRDFPRNLTSAMEEGKLRAGDLRLDITESALGQHLDEAAVSVKAIRDVGVSVGLDDFGSGVTSLKSMINLPLDSVKLDRSFASHLGGAHDEALLMDYVLTVANSLGISVVAEGIESLESLNYLKGHHCPQGQGFLFTHPLSSGEFEAWYKQRAA